MLHIVNHSPYAGDSLRRCLDYMAAEDALLLIEDGVYAARACGPEAERLAKLGARLHVLRPDYLARGLDDSSGPPEARWLDYAGFVELTVAHPQSYSWL